MIRQHRYQSYRSNHQQKLLALFLLLASLLLGCSDPESTESLDAESLLPEVISSPITALVIEDPELGVNMARQWSARRGGELTVVDQTIAQWRDSKFSVAPEVDVLIYPPGLLGELVSMSSLEPFPKAVWNSEEISKRELLKHARKTLVEYDNEVWAVPLGSPPLLMIYRNDLLAAAKIDVPESWEEFSDAAKQIQAAEMEQPVAERIAMPRSTGWAANLLLARAAASVRHRGTLSTVFERNTMQPLIASPPFVAALADLKLIAGRADWAESMATPADVYRSLLENRAVLGLGWPSASFASDGSGKVPPDSLTITALPGSSLWYDRRSKAWIERTEDEPTRVDLIGFSGMIGSVSANSRNTAASFEFLQWLCSKPTSLLASAESPHCGPFRASHLGNPLHWTGEQISPTAADEYANAIRATQASPTVLMFPRLPGYLGYVIALDEEVRMCLTGDSEPAAALQKASDRWETHTNRLGRQKQISSLRQASGL